MIDVNQEVSCTGAPASRSMIDWSIDVPRTLSHIFIMVSAMVSAHLNNSGRRGQGMETVQVLLSFRSSRRTFMDNFLYPPFKTFTDPHHVSYTLPTSSGGVQLS